MRGVIRSSSPRDVNLLSYQHSNAEWRDLSGLGTPQAKRDYGLLRRRLHGEFSGLCAFCERAVPRKGQPGPIEHFRPRNPATGSQVSHFGADLTFDWLNLVYACPECQDGKRNKWPGTLPPSAEESIDGILAEKAGDEGWTYVPVPVADGYVDPSGTEDDPAEAYFAYDELYCLISPSPYLPDDRRSKALRTIYDIGLDDALFSQERRIHIEELKRHLDAKGTQRRSQEVGRLVSRHQRRCLQDTKPSAYEPAVRFTGLVLYASREGWF